MATQPSRLEANRLYWDTDASVGEIAEQLGVSRRALYALLEPTAADGPCSGCGEPLVFANRLARASGEAVCRGCGQAAQVLVSPRPLAEAREAPALSAPTARSRRPPVEDAPAQGEPPEDEPVELATEEPPALPEWTSPVGIRRPHRTLRLAGLALLAVAAGIALAAIARRRGR